MIYNEIYRYARQYPYIQSIVLLICLVVPALILVYLRRYSFSQYLLAISIAVPLLVSAVDLVKYVGAIHSTRSIDRIISYLYYPILPPTNTILAVLFVVFLFKICRSPNGPGIALYAALLLIVVPVHWLMAIVAYDMYLHP
jgi:hypothetical protein